MNFGSKKAIFGVILGCFEGFGPCLGISHPTHPHLGEISQKKRFFFDTFPKIIYVKDRQPSQRLGVREQKLMWTARQKAFLTFAEKEVEKLVCMKQIIASHKKRPFLSLADETSNFLTQEILSFLQNPANFLPPRHFYGCQSKFYQILKPGINSFSRNFWVDFVLERLLILWSGFFYFCGSVKKWLCNGNRERRSQPERESCGWEGSSLKQEKGKSARTERRHESKIKEKWKKKKSRMKEKCKKAKMKARAKMVSKENILPPSLPSPPRGQVQCYTAESVKEIYPESK